MAKKLVALTNIKHDEDFYEAGSEMDSSKFTEDQLKELMDNGAIEVQEGSEKKSSSAATATNEGEQQQKSGDEPKQTAGPDTKVTPPKTK